MSIEAKLDALTEALNKNTAALLGKAEPASKPAKPAKPEPQAPVASAVPTPTAAPSAAPAAGSTGPSYQELADVFLKELMPAVQRDAALAVIAPLPALNAIKAGEQHPGQYAELLKKMKAAVVAAHKPAEQSAAASLV